MTAAPRYPGIRVTANGNQLVSYHTETRIADAGVFYPITPSTEMGELYQQSYAEGRLNVFGGNTLAVEAEVGGWGAITTGKNLGAILGDLNDLLYERDKIVDELGNPKEIIHVSANPKYGSEKKGAPTAYFLVAAPERIRVNCDLRHVTVVLCCDPRAFTHTNPLAGMADGGCLVWESDATGEAAWERLPLWARKQVIDQNIRVFTFPGFQIARTATDRADLQLRMQGNAFLGAFFAVSPLLGEFGITQEQFRDVVHKQYVKKFGQLGEAVVKSNMEVMTQGFEQVQEVRVGKLEAKDRSSLRGEALLPTVCGDNGDSCHFGCRSFPVPAGQAER